MTVYKRGSTWRADVSTSRKGEKPARISRSFDTKVEAENFEKNTRQQIESARASGMQLPVSGKSTALYPSSVRVGTISSVFNTREMGHGWDGSKTIA
ncbi:MAG: hypothetical protein ABI040_06475 [Rhodoferax sp.]